METVLQVLMALNLGLALYSAWNVYKDTEGKHKIERSFATFGIFLAVFFGMWCLEFLVFLIVQGVIFMLGVK